MENKGNSRMKLIRGRALFECLSLIGILTLAVVSLAPPVQRSQHVKLDHERLTYTGYMNKNKFAGTGTLEMHGGDQYVGQFKDGRFNGTGQFISHSKWQLQGQFVNGDLTGPIKLRVGNKTYTKNIAKDGTLTDAN